MGRFGIYPYGNTRPPLQISQYGDDIVRDHKIIFSIDGVTQIERKQLEVVLLALNTLDLSEPKVRRALTAVVRTSPTWRVGRSDEQVEALSS